MSGDFAPPAAGEVLWDALNPEREIRCKVSAQTWVVARAKAAALMGCEPGQLLVTVEEVKKWT